MAEQLREVWTVVDSRTGERCTMSSYFTREQAERQIEEWRARDRRGKRPDVHDLMPYVEARRVQ